MEARVIKKQTAFRLDEDLLIKLKKEAKRANRSLSNYVECILMDRVYNKPNQTTTDAMREVESGVTLDTPDMDNFDKYVASL